jgi:hypothetical protein
MASTSQRVEPAFSDDQWSDEASADADVRPIVLERKLPSLARRSMRAVVRFLITFGIGVAATLAWQSYGDVARQVIASSSSRLGWLAPQAQAAPSTVALAQPAAPPPDLQMLKTMSLSLAAVRQSVDQLAAQLASGNQQMAGDIASMQAAQQAILRKISAPPPPPKPAAPPARSTVQLAPPSPDAPPAH